MSWFAVGIAVWVLFLLLCWVWVDDSLVAAGRSPDRTRRADSPRPEPSDFDPE